MIGFLKNGRVWRGVSKGLSFHSFLLKSFDNIMCFYFSIDSVIISYDNFTIYIRILSLCKKVCSQKGQQGCTSRILPETLNGTSVGTCGARP